ncbi:hypothetical protein HDU91_002471 [Kappamyces sp. JEL0680]|nr:hypothetical protein HDU91_002471 [Kappamyces sp. JEL0680]
MNAVIQSLVVRLSGYDSQTFEMASAPFTSVPFVACTVIGYLSILYGIQSFMAAREKPIQFPTAFYVHNLLLCVVSAVLLGSIGEIAFSDWSQHGIFHAICDPTMGFNNHLNWLYYLNYLTKMYYYYAETSRGKRFWWKKHLTTLQIIQFVVDLVFIGTSLYFALQTPKACQMEDWAGYLGMGLISSYLLLFVDFFLRTYVSKPRSVKAAKLD